MTDSPTDSPRVLDVCRRLRETGSPGGRHFLLESGENVIGSGRDCSCRLRDRGVSRRHAAIHIETGSCFLVDLDSKNGTLRNGREVQRERIEIGDEIGIGPTRWIVDAVADDDVELAIDIEPPTAHGEVTSIEHPTSPLDGSRQAIGIELPEGIVACVSTAMQDLYDQLHVLRQGDVSVLIHGETGTGKEHVAQLVHSGSSRHQQPFIAINCAAVPSDLLEAELFGVGKGVATGVSARVGKIRQAEGGTLFLDEIGELAPALQAKLLRVLQEHEIAPLGEHVRSVDVRFVAATNTQLEERISSGDFRADLYYRLAGYVLTVPPLRQRPRDVALLCAHFMRQLNRETGKSVRGVTVKALRRLTEHPWPGNVRELQNAMRRLVYRCPSGQAITATMLENSMDHGIGDETSTPGGRLEAVAAEIELDALPLGDYLAILERRLVERALVHTQGNRSAAARLLGVSRNGLAIRLRRLGLDEGC